MDLMTLLVICLVFGGITAAIAQAKHLSVGQWFVVGALLSLIGVVLVIFAPSGLPKAPAGMRAVKCPRCNTVQNTPEAEPVYECWQCKATHRLWGSDPQAGPTKPTKPAKATSKVKCHKCEHVQSVPASQQTFVCEECGTKLKRRTAPAKGS
jgi:ribosomal protein S27E